MANQSVLELAVGTGQWDAGLKKAKSALDNFTQANGGLQSTLEKESQKMQQFVRMMGQMDSTAKTAKGQMNDYKSTIEQLTMQYNRMTDAQKKAIGQDYLQAIDQMKQKYQAVNNELQEMNRTLNETKMPEISSGGSGGGLLSGLTGALSVAGGNLIASGVAKLGSEMKETIQQSIELARSGEGIRLAFDRLNRPDLLSNLKEATHGTVSELELMKAAVKFDDFKLPVEQLGTLLAFAQKKAKDTGQSVDYMVDSIVTGLGRKSLMILDNLGLSAAQIKERMAESGDMTKAVADIIKEQMAEAGEYVETAADRAARAAADAQNQMEELGRKAMPIAEEWGKAWNGIKVSGMEVLTYVLTPVAESLKDIREILSGEYELKIKANVPNYADDDGKTVWSGWKPGTDHTVQAPGGYVEVTDKNTGAVIGGQHFDNLNDANAIKDWQKTLFKTGSGKHGPTDEEIAAKIASQWEKTAIKSGIGADALKGSDIKETMSVWASMTDEAKESMLGLAKATEDLGDAQAKLGDKKVIEEMKKLNEQEMVMIKSAKTTATVVGSIGQAFSAIEDPAAKVAGTVAQAIASIALGYAQATVQATSMGPWAWVAFAATGLATMLSTISSIHSATGYAEGGIVKGNSYSGDNMMFGGDGLYGLNAGELVLTKAQQSNLAQSLQNGGGQTVRVVGKLAGKDLFICAENWAKSAGKGEFVTW